MILAYMTWPETYGNGPVIGTTPIITKNWLQAGRSNKTQKEPKPLSIPAIHMLKKKLSKEDHFCAVPLIVPVTGFRHGWRPVQILEWNI